MSSITSVEGPLSAGCCPGDWRFFQMIEFKFNVFCRPWFQDCFLQRTASFDVTRALASWHAKVESLKFCLQWWLHCELLLVVVIYLDLILTCPSLSLQPWALKESFSLTHTHSLVWRLLCTRRHCRCGLPPLTVSNLPLSRLGSFWIRKHDMELAKGRRFQNGANLSITSSLFWARNIPVNTRKSNTSTALHVLRSCNSFC